MQKFCSFLLSSFAALVIIALTHEVVAQTTGAPGAGTRLITLGTQVVRSCARIVRKHPIS
jgi:hypothetical protein